MALDSAARPGGFDETLFDNPLMRVRLDTVLDSIPIGQDVDARIPTVSGVLCIDDVSVSRLPRPSKSGQALTILC